MIINYFKTAIRTLKADKIYSLINIAGLSIGLLVFIVVLLFVNREKSYDKWDSSLKQVYRVGVSEVTKDGIQKSQAVPYPLGTFLNQNFPEVEMLARVKVDYGEYIVSTEPNNPFYFNKVINADSNFFRVFPYIFLRGSNKALDEPNTVVITKDIAYRLFGNKDPIGKSIRINLKNNYTVSGVIEKPGPSHLDFDICLSYHSKYFASNWFMKNFDTYVKLRYDAKPVLLTEKVTRDYASNYALSYKQFGEGNGQEKDIIKWLAEKHGVKNPAVFFEPVQKIHLYPEGNLSFISELPVYDYSKYNSVPVITFFVIGILVLLLACINYINMSVAQNIKRAKESGVRKVMGASKTHLITQNVINSFLICFISLAVALSMAVLLGNWLNQQFDLKLQLWNVFYQKQNTLLLLQLITILIVTSLVTGIYPAYVLSAYEPVKVLKGEVSTSKKARWLQNSLIVLQYGIASCFIICIIIISSQLNYMRNSDPGFKSDQVLRIQPKNIYLFPGQATDQSAYVKESLMKIPGVTGFSSGDGYPGMSQRTENDASSKNGTNVNVAFSLVNYDYFKVLGISIIEGREFSTKFGKDTIDAAVINQTMASRFGWKNAIGQQFELMGKTYNVIGVVKDSKLSGFETLVPPQVFMMGVYDPRNFSPHEQVFVKISPKNIKQTLKSIIAFWKKTEPEFPVKYSWLDEDFAKLLVKYERFDKIVFWLAIISVLIAVMGIFALSIHSAKNRTKEIGIRKVLGASVSEIVTLLSGKFVKLVLVSFFISIPVAIIIAGKWLQNFAYRVAIEWWMFLIAITIILLVAFISVSFQAIKAAIANPVKSLRTE